MDSKVTGCECSERIESTINSQALFMELKSCFENKVEKGVYCDIKVQKPYYVGRSQLDDERVEWYATKWYQCKACGCLWEFLYPDFPAQGFVRKFSDGKYIPKA